MDHFTTEIFVQLLQKCKRCRNYLQNISRTEYYVEIHELVNKLIDGCDHQILSLKLRCCDNFGIIHEILKANLLFTPNNDGKTFNNLAT